MEHGESRAQIFICIGYLICVQVKILQLAFITVNEIRTYLCKTNISFDDIFFYNKIKPNAKSTRQNAKSTRQKNKKKKSFEKEI